VHPVIYAADIGSITAENFDWARLDVQQDSLRVERDGGAEIADLVEAVVPDPTAGEVSPWASSAPFSSQFPPMHFSWARRASVRAIVTSGRWPSHASIWFESCRGHQVKAYFGHLRATTGQ
jgi:hypothetical protein